mgnify:CR=1 FL=1
MAESSSELMTQITKLLDSKLAEFTASITEKLEILNIKVLALEEKMTDVIEKYNEHNHSYQ